MREHDAVAVGDHAAVGRDRHDRDAIVLGKRLVVLVLHHLQVDEAAEEPAKPKTISTAATVNRRRKCASSRSVFLSSGAAMPLSERPRLVKSRRIVWPVRQSSARDSGGRCGHCSNTVTAGHSNAPVNGPTA